MPGCVGVVRRDGRRQVDDHGALRFGPLVSCVVDGLDEEVVGPLGEMGDGRGGSSGAGGDGHAQGGSDTPEVAPDTGERIGGSAPAPGLVIGIGGRGGGGGAWGGGSASIDGEGDVPSIGRDPGGGEAVIVRAHDTEVVGILGEGLRGTTCSVRACSFVLTHSERGRPLGEEGGSVVDGR